MVLKQADTPYDNILTDLLNENPPNEFTSRMTSVLREVIGDYYKEYEAHIDFRRKIREDEYIELLKWSLENKKENTIRALLSDPVFEKFNDKLMEVLIAAFNNNNVTLFTSLLKNSNYLIENLPKVKRTKAIEFGMNGATMLHLAAYLGKTEFCQAMIEIIPEFKQAKDYHGNNILHYAAVRNTNHCYDELSKAYPYLTTLSNLFNHLPEQYQNQGYKQFINIGQLELIKKFADFINIDNRDKDAKKNEALIKSIKSGECYGVAFISAVQALRGEKSWNAYNHILELVSQWDGKENTLENSIDDTYLQSMGLKTTRQAVNYIFNLFTYFYHMQEDKSTLDVSKSDRVTQLSNINAGKDAIADVTSYVDIGMSKDICKELILRHLKPNTMLMFNTTVDSEHFLQLGMAGHAISLAVDANGKIFLSDPNFMFKPSTLSKDNIDQIVDILYDRLIPASIFVYNYIPDKRLTLTSNREDSYDYHRFLVGKHGDAHKVIGATINHDAPHMLLSCLKSLETPLEKNQVVKFTLNAIESRSYQCANILLDHYKMDVNELNLDEGKLKEFKNYLHNTLKP